MAFAFGPFEVDAELFELRREGVPVAVQRKAFDLLVYLIERKDVVCTKKQILEAVWPDVVVTDTALTQVMMTLRRTLGDDDGAPRYIQTVRGRGYRFVAPIRGDATSLESPSAPEASVSPEPKDGAEPIGHVDARRAIDAALAEVQARRPSVALIGGRPGLGRSYLCSEIASLARRLRVAAVVLRCAVTPGAPALLPWVTLAKRLDDLPPSVADASTPLAASTDVFASTEGIVVRIERAARIGPLVVVLDDVHAMDPASARVLLALAPRISELQAGLVVTYRHGAALPALDALARLPMTRVVELRALDGEETRRFLAREIGHEPDASLTQRLLSKTGGSPLLLRQVAHVLRAERAFEMPKSAHANTSVLLGGGPLKGAIAAHLEQLHEDTRSVLSAGAVLGAELTVTTVASMLGLGHDTVLERLDAAVSSDVVASLRDGRGTYRFTHVLVRDALYRSLGEAERVRLHAAAGRALVAMHGEEARGRYAAAVASHFVVAASGGEAESAVTFSLAAAAHALDSGDRAAALQHVEAASRSAACAPASPARLAAIDAMRSRLHDGAGEDTAEQR
ncbi:MAG: winged helix-turn-helix domain-containing protein [Deltaproteobacteria bacterium]|nr:winged helix-turn-helix domain-containing protein [Deltaproteobacteria bacterium]